jgi:hypothetical protein
MKFTIAATLLASASAFTVNQPKVDFAKVSLKVRIEKSTECRAEHATVTARHEPCCVRLILW